LASLQLLSRPDCSLCDAFLADLQRLGTQLPLPDCEVLDIDDYPVLARRYGLDVPVLLLDGHRVCQHRLDQSELIRLLRPR
jgi:Glutaredoxin-like domain (DUF836)